ncbi:MAG: hypothetical protein LBF43_01665 [Puniceicoccales bacterium]|jgi:hypothetical protein|nr:hypothetical protein [Puniceicoccales bacterium]
MKTLYRIIVINVACFCLKSVCWGNKSHYRVVDDYPSSDHIRLLYQIKTIDGMFHWNIQHRHYVLTPIGEPIYRSIQDLASECIGGLPRVEKPTCDDQRSLAVNAFLRKYIALRHSRDHVGVFLDFLARRQSLTSLVPLPEMIIPVEDIIEQDFNHKPFAQIFGECMRTPSMGMIMRGPEYCEKRIRGGENCDIPELDRDIIAKVLNEPSNDKTVLFVGFDQTLPTEGGNIYAHTPGYTRSLFLSAWGDHLSSDHNQIKTCFCQMPRLLEVFPDMCNAFDYIIVGGQTREYVYPEAWVAFGRMLKPGGRLVYPAYGSSPHHDQLFSSFLNRTLMESIAEEGFNFALYKCDHASEPIYQTIQTLASFNDEPTYGSFCYAQGGALFWHKKIALARE